MLLGILSVDETSSVTLDAEARPAGRDVDLYDHYQQQIEAAKTKTAVSAVVADMRLHNGLLPTEMTELIDTARRRYANLVEFERQSDRNADSRPDATTTEASIDDNSSIDGDSQ